MFRDLEKQMENYVDDLLVDANLENPRCMIRVIVPRDYKNELVRMKAPTRVNVKLEFTKLPKPKLFITVRYNHAVCHFDANTLKPTVGETEMGIPQPINTIMRYINKMFRQFHKELQEAKRTKPVFDEFAGWTTVRNDLVKSFYDENIHRS